MKIRNFFAFLLLTSCSLAGVVGAQDSRPGYLDPSRVVSGNLAAAGAICTTNCVQMPLASGNSACSANIAGTFSGSMVAEVSSDSNNWSLIALTPNTGGTAVSSFAAAFSGSATLAGFTWFRIRMSGYVSGSAAVSIYCAPVTSVGTINGSSGGGTNAIASPLCNTGTAVCTFSLNAPLPTIAPGNYPGVTVADPNGVTFPAITPTATPSAAVPMIPVVAALYAQCGTSGLMCPVPNGGQSTSPTSRDPLDVILCNSSAGVCQVVTGTGADGIANTVMGAMNQTSFGYAFNGTTWDRARKDATAAGPMWMTTGGGSTASAASAATTVIKNSAGRLAKLVVTTIGTGIFTCFDNASAGSGTVIGAFPASAVVGTVETLDMPAANGITCVSAASGPVVTVSFW